MKLFLNLLIHYYLNNTTDLYQLTLQSTTSCPQHGDPIVTIDYCDVTSPCVFFVLGTIAENGHNACGIPSIHLVGRLKRMTVVAGAFHFCHCFNAVGWAMQRAYGL